MLETRLPPFVRDNYECREWHHASAVMVTDYPEEWRDLMDVLSAYRLHEEYIRKQGGNKSKTAIFFDGFLKERGWRETKFATKVVVDEIEYETPTHKIDMFKNGIAVEVEWNNKDPFFDRDLNNFRLLYGLRTVSVGVVITRSYRLKDLFAKLDRKLEMNTTHINHLVPRIEGGGAGGCPVLIFGILPSLYRESGQ